MIGGFASRIRASRREGCITILSSVMPEEGGKEVRTEEREGYVIRLIYISQQY